MTFTLGPPDDVPSPVERTAPGAPGSRWAALARAGHPRQALVLGAAVGALALLAERPPREAAIAAGAVLLSQLALGMTNDLVDQEADARSGAPDKPVAHGLVAPGDVAFALAVLLLLLTPMALQNGTLAGGSLLATLGVGLVHNRWLKSTALSPLGWAATFALLVAFLSYGGWGAGRHGGPPSPELLVAAASLGVGVHVLTALPDLVADHRAGVRHLPLRIALRTGAPRLLVAALVYLALAGAAAVWAWSSVGLTG